MLCCQSNCQSWHATFSFLGAIFKEDNYIQYFSECVYSYVNVFCIVITLCNLCGFLSVYSQICYRKRNMADPEHSTCSSGTYVIKVYLFL